MLTYVKKIFRVPTYTVKNVKLDDVKVKLHSTTLKCCQFPINLQQTKCMKSTKHEINTTEYYLNGKRGLFLPPKTKLYETTQFLLIMFQKKITHDILK